MQQISNYPLGSKENPFFISSKEEFLNIPPKSYNKYYTCICLDCGTKIYRRQVRNKVFNWNTMLCSNCVRKHNMYKGQAAFKEKYGVDNPGQLPDHKEKINQKMAQRLINNPEEEHNRCKEVARKGAETRKLKGYKHGEVLFERYGVHSAFELASSKETIKEKYGSHNEMARNNAKKSKITKKERYGDENYVNIDAIKKTNQLKYGVDFYCVKKECYSRKLYFYDNEYFDSSWELAYYYFLKSNKVNFTFHPTSIEYFVNGKKHHYFPDFIVDGRFVEIKGDNFFENGKMINPSNRSKDNIAQAKFDLMKELNVKILRMSDIKEYLTFCKIHKFILSDYKCQ